jgi:hypothetical protein
MEQQVLKEELEYFEANRARLLRKSPGKYVLIHKNKEFGVYDRKGDALKAGYKKFRIDPFLVRLISDSPRRLNFMSNVALCSPCQQPGV